MVAKLRSILVVVGAAMLLTLGFAWIPPLVNPPMVGFPGLGLPQGQFVPWVGAPHTRWLGEPSWLATVGRDGIGVRRSLGCVEAASYVYSLADPGWDYLLAGGWPFYAFHGGGWQVPRAVQAKGEGVPAVFALPSWVPSRQNHPPTIPIAPCWRGLALNLLVWSLVVLSAWSGVGSLRRWVRGRRGRCVACGHPLLPSSSRCPECGTDRAVPETRP
jgi:hypothetical protein